MATYTLTCSDWVVGGLRVESDAYGGFEPSYTDNRTTNGTVTPLPESGTGAGLIPVPKGCTTLKSIDTSYGWTWCSYDKDKNHLYTHDGFGWKYRGYSVNLPAGTEYIRICISSYTAVENIPTQTFEIEYTPTWEVVNNALTHPDLPDPITDYITPPLPIKFWMVEDNKLTHQNLPEALQHVLAPPYPNSMWHIIYDDDLGERLYHNGLPDPIILAAGYRFIYNGHDINRVIYNGADITNVIYPSE